MKICYLFKLFLIAYAILVTLKKLPPPVNCIDPDPVHSTLKEGVIIFPAVVLVSIEVELNFRGVFPTDTLSDV